MTDLFNAPELSIEKPSAQLHYSITDQNGDQLADVPQVGGPPSATSAFAGMTGPAAGARVVLQVTRPDGAALFYIDRGEHAPGLSRPPCAIVAPDGTIIGRIEHHTRAENFMAGTRDHVHWRFRYERSQRVNAGQNVFGLLDPNGQPFCKAEWEPMEVSQHGTRSPGGQGHAKSLGDNFADYIDMNKVPIARLEREKIGLFTRANRRFTLRLSYQLPEPMRTLVIASPIAMDIMHAAVGQ